MEQKVSLQYEGKEITISTGSVANQANGSVWVTYDNTTVLVTATAQKEAPTNTDFFPLTCIYQVKTYSQGKILGGFIKRERQLSEMETLISRIIDRPIRPLFPDTFKSETQVIATVVSYSHDANPAIAAVLGASASLLISNLPYTTPIAAINVGRIDGEWIANPSPTQLQESDIDLFLVAKEDAIVMVEAGCKIVSEKDLLAGLKFGFKAVQPLIKIQAKLQKLAGKEKWEAPEKEDLSDLEKKIAKLAKKDLDSALDITDKLDRYAALDKVKSNLKEELCNEEDADAYTSDQVSSVFSELKRKTMRDNILKKEERVDKRSLTEVRPITCQPDTLPQAHGSVIFTRGETQALVVATLGTKDDEQVVEDPSGVYSKNFFLHYNFPPYSVGEVKRLGAPGRREIGHGNLAERGLRPVLPSKESFPYTIRLVSEILSSNGSSSMASVCGGSLAMMDAGVPISESVAGVAMGMVSEKSKHAILTDILGDEDHIGDMDFKVVGTKNGVTALQMDIKIDGLSFKLLEEALTQAKEGRLHIINEMEKKLATPKDKVSPLAPRFIQHRVHPDKIKTIIGAGGKTIKALQAETNTKININDEGIVTIAASQQEDAEKAVAMIRELTKEVEIGTIYEGRIVKIMEFGAFTEVLPGIQGLLHVSEVTGERIEKLETVLSENQIIKVKAIGHDKRGKLKLSMRDVPQD